MRCHDLHWDSMAMRAHPKAMYGADVTGGSRDVTSKCLICESRCWRLLTQALFSLCLFFSFFWYANPRDLRLPLPWCQLNGPCQRAFECSVPETGHCGPSLSSMPIWNVMLLDTWPCFTDQPNSLKEKKAWNHAWVDMKCHNPKVWMNSPATQYISGNNTT